MKSKRIISQEAKSQFLALLRSGLWGNKADISVFRTSDGPDWNGILYLGKTQAVLPLIFDGMLTLPADMQLKGQALLKMIAYVDRVEKLNARLDAAAAEISDRLKEKGIRSVLLKGQGIAALYRKPEHRQCGDIDLYVGEANYQHAADIIRSWKEVHDEMPESTKHIAFGFDDMELELHRNTLDIHDLKLEMRYRAWETAEMAKDECIVTLPGAGPVTVPPAQFNIFYVFYHAFNHFMTLGLGLRQLCDLAILLHTYHDRIDVRELESRLKEYKLDKEWRLFTGLLTDALGLPEGEAPLYDRSQVPLSGKLLDTIFNDGNFGHHKDLPDFSAAPKYIRKTGNLFNRHISMARRLKYSIRQAAVYYISMWRNGLKNINK